MRSFSWWAAAFPLLLGPSACGAEPVECNLMAVYSVKATVVDIGGDPALDVAVRYSVDGGDERAADCVDGQAGSCETWVAGTEEAGLFELRAQSIDGKRLGSAVTTVSQDECHVVTETGTIEIQ